MGFVPNMRVPCVFYVNDHLQALMFEELEQYVSRGDVGGFLPAVKQLANVAALPGIVKASIALPDVHSGYGFAIGNVAAFDMDDPESIVSPGAPPPHASWPCVNSSRTLLLCHCCPECLAHAAARAQSYKALTGLAACLLVAQAALASTSTVACACCAPT
jgi:hypothetical protein